MFDDTQLVKVKWCSKNKKYYINKGYVFTKMYDEFLVKAKDLQEKSTAQVKYICEFCGKEKEGKYLVVRKSLSRGKLCCGDCKKYKVEQSFVERYGSCSVGGVFYEKAQKSKIAKYGSCCNLADPLFREKFEQAMLKKYGHKNASHIKQFHEKSVANVLTTLISSNKIPTSKPERETVELVKTMYGEENCFPCYRYDNCIFDCLIVLGGMEIDLEYDGKYWHEKKRDKDRKRNFFLISKGYKVIRILANNKDTLPTFDQIATAVDLLYNGRNLVYIDIETQTIR